NDHILPHLINLSMRNRELHHYRQRVVSLAKGRVLEIGTGSGLNLAFYGDQVEQLVGLEPATRLLAMARERTKQTRTPATLIAGSGEAIPLDARSFDSIVMTWTLCSIPGAAAALKEIRGVLKPEGQLLFVEHGLAPEPSVQRPQNRLTPLWKK